LPVFIAVQEDEEFEAPSRDKIKGKICLKQKAMIICNQLQIIMAFLYAWQSTYIC